ncbi:MAG: histidine phosphatase family protein [Magnetovibrionaceae bacterium]
MRTKWRLALAALAITFALSAPIQATETSPIEIKSSEQAAALLQPGGYVIYLRHAATDHSQKDRSYVFFSDCSTQRNLSALGRQQSGEIGAAFEKADIKVGLVLTSPYCRCAETAEMAFGKAEMHDFLAFSTLSGPEKRASDAEELRQELQTPPVRGTNTVIVSHTGNLREAVKIWPKPEGVMFVFDPESATPLAPIARIAPEIWMQASER